MVWNTQIIITKKEIVMKKMTLLFTLTLVCALVCADQMYGMEPRGLERGHYTGFTNLPKDLQVLIIQTLNTYKNPDDVIKTIKAISKTNMALNQIINEVYNPYNLSGFTALVHKLADKFDKPTATIAEKFSTQTAHKYINLGNDLINQISSLATSMVLGLPVEIDKIVQLIEAGADVNYSIITTGKSTLTPQFQGRQHEYTMTTSDIVTPMKMAMLIGSLKAIQVLLDHGAKLESNEYYDEHEYWPPVDPANKAKIKELFERIRQQK